MSEPIEQFIKDVLPQVRALRQELHAHPELSFKEFETSRRIRERLAGVAGLKVLPPLMDTDVIALLNADRSGPCIALRADIDALPITEENDLPYKSKTPGLMHACGHDGHAAVLVGTAMVLAAMADQLPGKVKFIFQPAEEDRGGASVLCERGVLESPKVDAAVALHAWPNQPAGSIAIRRGPATAATNDLNIVIRGKTGHGAYPHRCIDPIAVAAEVVLASQTIVSRMVPPLEPAVLSITQFNAGTANNVIPQECKLRGTIRYYRQNLGEQMRARLKSICDNLAKAHGAEAEVFIRIGYPPLLNDERLAELIETTGRELLGADKVITTEDPSMGAEDFAFYAQHVPGAMFRLGNRATGLDSSPGLHTPRFDFNDEVLAVGMRMMCEVTRRYLRGDC